jgi:very-short-patch-repair endonuclease
MAELGAEGYRIPGAKMIYLNAGHPGVARGFREWLDSPEERRVRELRAALEGAWDTPRRWKIIREYYAIRGPHIEAGRKLSPYELGLGEGMTPIEAALWHEIRLAALPFYLQYPVGRRFVDFGDPVMRIAIEADGKAYHTPEKDAQKDAELAEQGWTVFRVTGRDAIYKKHNLAGVFRLYGRPEMENPEWD